MDAIVLRRRTELKFGAERVESVKSGVDVVRVASERTDAGQQNEHTDHHRVQLNRTTVRSPVPIDTALYSKYTVGYGYPDCITAFFCFSFF